MHLGIAVGLAPLAAPGRRGLGCGHECSPPKDTNGIREYEADFLVELALRARRERGHVVAKRDALDPTVELAGQLDVG
jgi:hypothetical protein